MLDEAVWQTDSLFQSELGFDARINEQVDHDKILTLKQYLQLLDHLYCTIGDKVGELQHYCLTVSQQFQHLESELFKSKQQFDMICQVITQPHSIVNHDASVEAAADKALITKLQMQRDDGHLEAHDSSTDVENLDEQAQRADRFLEKMRLGWRESAASLDVPGDEDIEAIRAGKFLEFMRSSWDRPGSDPEPRSCDIRAERFIPGI